MELWRQGHATHSDPITSSGHGFVESRRKGTIRLTSGAGAWLALFLRRWAGYSQARDLAIRSWRKLANVNLVIWGKTFLIVAPVSLEVCVAVTLSATSRTAARFGGRAFGGISTILAIVVVDELENVSINQQRGMEYLHREHVFRDQAPVPSPQPRLQPPFHVPEEFCPKPTGQAGLPVRRR